MEYIIYKMIEVSKLNSGGDRPKIYSDTKTNECCFPIFSNGLQDEGLYGYTNKATMPSDTITVSARGANIGEVFYPKEDSFIPCTAAAVIKMLEFYDLDLTGKNAVVLGRSNVIGKPVAMLLLAKNATVTVCHSRTQNLKEVCKNADVLVSAIGKAHFVTKEFVKEGAIVVDVGTNYDENGKVTGDVHFDEVSEIASYINPVPGGIGSITTSVLAEKCFPS